MKANQNGKTKILIAEDSRTQADQLSFLLEQHGYRVTIAADGKQALLAAQAQKPTLIISDIVMPEMDGYELCKAIKSDEVLKDVPVILVTTLSDVMDIMKGLECGADNFIRKPYDEKYLLARVDYLLMNQEMRKSQKMQIGMEIHLGGQRHFITAERQQIVDLLISVYEEAIHLNEELKVKQSELADSNRALTGLYHVAEGLNHAVSERGVCEKALEHALELPGVRAGWISLREGESGFRLGAVRNLPPALQVPGAMEGLCECRRRLLAGELDHVTNILECDRLGKAKDDTQGLHYHASVPLWNGDQIMGVMNLVGAEQGLFREDELETLYGVGHQVGIALERARMHEHLEQLVEERTAALTAEISERKQAEEKLKLFRTLLDNSSDAIEVLEPVTMRFLDINETGCRILGYSREELLSMSISDIDPTLSADSQEKIVAQLQQSGHARFETVHRRKDGSTFPVEVSATFIELDNPYMLGIVRDITRRKANEARIARLNRIYAVLSGINTTIVRVHDEDELFREACRVAVEQGQFTFAWIGQFDADTRQVMPVARAGRDDGYLAQINLDARVGIKGSCILTTQALTEVKPVVCNDIDHDERMAVWRSAALSRGYRSVVVFPLVVEGRPVGVFALYSSEPEVFDEDEMRLLIEMAGDISYALDYFSHEAQRKQAEVALEESRSLLKTVIDTSPMRIFWKDKESRYLGCNPAFAMDAGKTAPEDLLGKDDYQMGWKEQAELYRADDRRVMDSGIPKLSYDEPQTTPDGKAIWLRTSKVPLRNAANETIGVLGIYEDITERKQTELALQRSESDLNRAQAVAQIGSWRLDIASNRLEWSAEAHRIFGVPGQGAVNLDTFISTLHPDDRDRVLNTWNAAVAGAPYDIEHRIVADGQTRWVRERAIIERDAEGRALFGVGTTQDITDRKKAEDELRKLSLAVEQSPNSIVITDLDAKLEYVNEAFVRATGYSRAEAIGQNPRILHSGKNSREAYDDMWTHLTRGEMWKGELINRRKDGSEYVESILVSPVRDADGRITHYLGIKEDITERKLAESKLAEQIEELRRWHDATLGREMRTIELKREVNELLGQSGQPPRYPSAEPDDTVGQNG